MWLTIDITEEGLGCTATCREIPQLYGYGNTPKEARAMFWREVQSMWKDLRGSGEFSQEFVELKEKLSQVIPCKQQRKILLFLTK